MSLSVGDCSLLQTYSRVDWERVSAEDLRTLAGEPIQELVVGALVKNDADRIFAQKRSASRKLFPGCWDIAGGHVELGETLFQALARELREETGWQLVRIVEAVAVFDWASETDGIKRFKREFDFLVEVTGDLEEPRLEAGKCDEFRWFGPEDTHLLKENRAAGDTMIHDIVVAAIRRLAEKNARTP